MRVGAAAVKSTCAYRSLVRENIPAARRESIRFLQDRSEARDLYRSFLLHAVRAGSEDAAHMQAIVS